MRSSKSQRIRSGRFGSGFPEGQPHLCVLQLSSENDGSGVVHSYAATADILEQLATALRKQAKTMPR